MKAVASKVERPIGHILKGLSWEEYRALPGTNFSTAKVMDRSAKHYLHNLQAPKEGDTLRLGAAAHTAVLEPMKFASTYCVWRERDRDGDTAARKGEKFKSFLAEHPGRQCITEDQETEALRYQLAVSACPEAMEYLALGEAEVTLKWRLGNRDCKGRIDWLTDLGNGPVIVGLKTCADVTGDFFERQATRLLYGAQWAFYADGFHAITGKQPVEVVEIVVEKSAPYDVVVYQICDEELEIGRAKYTELLDRLDECERTQQWPGVGRGGKKRFYYPSWVYREDDDVTGVGLQW